MLFTLSKLKGKPAIVCVVLSSALALASAPGYAAQQTPPDNTKVNKRDREAGQKTADQQKNNKADLETSRQIRKAIVADKSLSTYAHNVKIISVDGKVTLKGPVRSADEKQAVEAKAAEVAGPANVIDQLSIKGDTATHHKSKTKKAGL